MGALSALMVAIGRESVKTWTLDHSIYQMYGLTDAGIILRTWRPDVKNGMAQMRRWLRYSMTWLCWRAIDGADMRLAAGIAARWRPRRDASSTRTPQ